MGQSDEPRPCTKAELVQWLDNIVAMHRFSEQCAYGSETHRLYVDGMPRAAAFIRDCVQRTPVIADPPEPGLRERAGAHAAEVLRAAVRVDPAALTALCEFRLFCSPLIETDTALVPFADAGGNLSLGLLGVLNGIVGTPTHRLIGHYSDADELVDVSYGAYPTQN